MDAMAEMEDAGTGKIEGGKEKIKPKPKPVEKIEEDEDAELEKMMAL